MFISVDWYGNKARVPVRRSLVEIRPLVIVSTAMVLTDIVISARMKYIQIGALQRVEELGYQQISVHLHKQIPPMKTIGFLPRAL